VLLGAEYGMSGVKVAFSLFRIRNKVTPLKIPSAELPELKDREFADGLGLTGGNVINRRLDKRIARGPRVLDEKNGAWDNEPFPELLDGQQML